MIGKMPVQCPSCSTPMLVTELACPDCETRVQGRFSPSPLFHMSPTQLEFVEVFLKCRGNIREVERELHISYPTVRSRLDEVIESLGHEAKTSPPVGKTAELIQKFEDGVLSFQETLDQLRKG